VGVVGGGGGGGEGFGCGWGAPNTAARHVLAHAVHALRMTMHEPMHAPLLVSMHAHPPVLVSSAARCALVTIRVGHLALHARAHVHLHYQRWHLVKRPARGCGVRKGVWVGGRGGSQPFKPFLFPETRVGGVGGWVGGWVGVVGLGGLGGRELDNTKTH
jgi:hypothetical protein